jgi:hypothetical protein
MTICKWVHAVFGLFLVSASHAQWFPEKAQSFSPEDRQRAEQQARNTLGKAPGTPSANRIQAQVSEGLAMLSGDLFADGRRVAVVELRELPAGLALMVCEQDTWHLQTLWNLSPVWISAGKTKADYPEYRRIIPEPPHTPFRLQDLDGDAIPELIVTFNNDGYRLGYAIIKKVRDEAMPRLLDVYSSLHPPQGLAGRLLTYNDSGRKAWWGETEYWRWEKGLPEHVATWHDNCFNPEKHFWAVSLAGSSETLRIAENEESEDGFVITRSDGTDSKEEFYAIVDFSWKPGKAPKDEVLNLYEAAQLYFFEKLLRMPAAAFDKEVNGVPVTKIIPLMKHLEIRVKGTPKAVQRLAPPVQQ